MPYTFDAKRNYNLWTVEKKFVRFAWFIYKHPCNFFLLQFDFRILFSRHSADGAPNKIDIVFSMSAYLWHIHSENECVLMTPSAHKYIRITKFQSRNLISSLFLTKKRTQFNFHEPNNEVFWLNSSERNCVAFLFKVWVFIPNWIMKWIIYFISFALGVWYAYAELSLTQRESWCLELRPNRHTLWHKKQSSLFMFSYTNA